MAKSAREAGPAPSRMTAPLPGVTPSHDDSAAVRRSLIKALRLDLIGPRPGDPAGASDAQRAQDAEEELDAPAEPVHGSDDSSTPERGSGKRAFLPSSMGLSILVDPETERLDTALSWGDYVPESGAAAEAGGAGRTEAGGDGDGAASRRRFAPWVRRPRAEKVAIDLSTARVGTPVAREVPGSGGLELVCLVRRTRVRTFDGDRDARAVALFVINRRPPAKDDDLQDTAFAFQVEMRVEADRALVPRYDPHGLDGDDWDERLADLHYHDIAEYAVGHNVSTRALALGESLPMIRKLLGHTQIQTTARYAHLARDSVKASASRVADSIGAELAAGGDAGNAGR